MPSIDHSHLVPLAEGQFIPRMQLTSWTCITGNILTTKDFDEHSVSRVFSFNERSHANDKKISEAGYECDNPDTYSEDIVSQEVLT